MKSLFAKIVEKMCFQLKKLLEIIVPFVYCPYCLFSKHVDINPGDRSNNCLGLLKPIGVEKFKNTYKIIYKCNNCNQLHKNIICDDDNMDLIIKLSVLEK